MPTRLGGDAAVLPDVRAPEAEAKPTLTAELSRSVTIDEVERKLIDLHAQGDQVSGVRLKVASSNDSQILTDIWTAILTGTTCRRHPTDVVAWGLQQPIKRDTSFAVTPAFLVAVAMARSVAPEHGLPVPVVEAQRVLAIVNEGLVDSHSGSAQNLVEFDPAYSLAKILRGRNVETAPALTKKKLFEQLVLRFRKRLEIGALRRRVTTGATGPAGDVGRFLAELHENGAEHGSRDTFGRKCNGTRLLRLRKHMADSREQLINRCAGFRPLEQYVQETFSENAAPVLIEASISDFGAGMVDGFLSSPAAAGIALPRRDLLQSLIYERLSSKSGDPSAGLGIQKALESARAMQAFVSLRTAEFWLTTSSGHDRRQTRLQDVEGGTHSPVVGTHWQILWPQP